MMMRQNNFGRRGRSWRRAAFTLTELMVALSIFSVASSAGTFLLVSAANTQRYVRASATEGSEVEFAMERMVENIRSANGVTLMGTGTIVITSPPSALASNHTFTITYTFAGGVLTETYVDNSNGQTFSSTALVHNVNQFSVWSQSAGKAFHVVLDVGTTARAVREFVVFGRNL
jgi:prepilin-type N-terminal cleavage/methylation domain-containing protein